MNQLRMAFKRMRIARPWTIEEDERLLAILDLQKRFATAAELIPERTISECKTRWHKLRGIEATALGRWHKCEKDTLQLAVNNYGLNWEKVAQEVRTRTPRQCRDYYNNTMSIKKTGKWEDWEDTLLRKGVQECGFKWSYVASHYVRGRTARQCRGRFLQNCVPAMKPAWTPWLPKEDLQLLQLVKKHGSRWAVIAESLEWTRSTMGCKARYGTLMGLRRRDRVGLGHTTPAVSKMLQALLFDLAHKPCEASEAVALQRISGA